jgi:adhesin/invasin
MHLVLLASAALGLGACGDGHCISGSGEICTMAGTGDPAFSGDGRFAPETDLYLPQDLTEGPDGQLYVVDWNNHRIRVITHEGRVQTVAGTGNTGEALPGPALRSDLTHPTQVAFDALGRMVIAAWHSGKIVRVDLATGQLAHLCGTGNRRYSGDGGPAATADFDLPAAIAYDASGNLYIMDQANQLIRKVDPAGTITRVAGQCFPCPEGAAPVVCEGSDTPVCVAYEDLDYRCTNACAGGFAGDGGPALEARIYQPYGAAAPPAGRLALDAAGNLYFADSLNHRIRRIDTNGTITTVAGNGSQGYAGDGGPATRAQLALPVDIEIASDGTLYVADTQNSCVRAVAPDGIIRTVAGTCGQRGFAGDRGPATEALLDRPYGIELDRDDNLYIADTHNHRIRFVPR